MSRLGSLRSGPLGVRSFRLLAGGQFTSTIGDYCYAVALPWLVLSNRGGTVLLGTVLACYGVPRMVLIPVGGVLSDKVGPRTVMLAADGARCVLVAGLAVLAARHTASLVALGPLAAFIGAGEGLFIPASFAIMPSLLDGERLGAGNAISTAAVQAGSLLGPALGGALVATTRASTWAFAADAASFAVSALTLALIPRRAATGTMSAAADEAAGAGAGAGDGGNRSVLAFLKRSRVLQVLLVVVIAANLAGGGEGEVALPSLAHARYGAAGYGALLACFAIGGVIGRLRFYRLPGLVGGDSAHPVPRRGGRGGRDAVRDRRYQRPGQRHHPDRAAEVGAPGDARTGDERADAVCVRQFPAVGGGLRGAGPAHRAVAVLPGRGRRGGGGHPGRADPAGVPGVRGGGASWGKYSHGTGGAGAGLKRLDVRLKRKKPQPSAAGTRGTAGSCDKAALVSNAALGSRK
jgi:MFS family permease